MYSTTLLIIYMYFPVHSQHEHNYFNSPAHHHTSNLTLSHNAHHHTITHLLVGAAVSQVAHLAASVGLVSTATRVHVSEREEGRELLRRVLPSLHLAVDHPCILPLPVDMVNLRQEGRVL